MELMISCGYIDKINILTEDIIKIPVSAIQTRDINLSQYLED